MKELKTRVLKSNIPKKNICLLCISLIMSLIIILVLMSGCSKQAAEQVAEKAAAGESSEEAEISRTLQDIDELNSMDSDLEEDMGLSEVEQMGYG
ncbi:MAG: hypothetical protein AB1668_01195 [Nanoarchaeota archaeon]